MGLHAQLATENGGFSVKTGSSNRVNVLHQTAHIIQQKRYQRYQALHIARLKLQIAFVFSYIALIVGTVELPPLHCRPTHCVLERLKHQVPVFTAVTMPAQSGQTRSMPSE